MDWEWTRLEVVISKSDDPALFQANPPNPEKIPEADLVGVTVVLLTCSYRGAEFIRIGYYVSNDYTEPELKETNPSPPQWGKLQRNILATNPR